MTLDQIQTNPEFKNTMSNFNSKNVDSNFVKLNPLDMTSNSPITVKLLTKDGSSSSSVYRLSPNFLIMTKIFNLNFSNNSPKLSKHNHVKILCTPTTFFFVFFINIV